jgi:hypothetical protein
MAILGLCCVLGGAGAQTGPDEARSRLSGEFSFYASEHCVHSSAFGPPPVLEPLGPTYTENSTIQGTLTLRADGTGLLTGRAASLSNLPTATPAQQSALRCTVTHAIERDDTLRLETMCKGTITQGNLSVAGQVWSAGPMRASGHLHADSFTAADTELAIETVTSFRGARTPRLCHRLWSGSRLGKSQ